LLPQVSQQSPELCRMELARQLLSRHGVLTRESVLAESIPGGFAGLYPVLRALEDAGQLRRGYFIEGLGAAQSVLPGTEERIRIHRSNQRKAKPKVDDAAATTRFLAATDPANPYGATLPWPAMPGRSSQFKRVASARVMISSGDLIGYLADTKNALTITHAESTAQIALVIAKQTEFIQRMLIEKINGVSATSTRI
jgi:ATP-dependent Lhr-like helicase